MYWHGEDRDVLTLLSLGVLAGEHVNYSQIITKVSIFFNQSMVILPFLRIFNTNTQNLHQHFKGNYYLLINYLICITPDTQQIVI